MNYEIELRSLLDEAKFLELSKKLKEESTEVKEDTKETEFILYPDKLAKVVSNLTSGKAKVSLKLNRIGDGNSFTEIEFPIDASDVESAKQLFNAFNPTKLISTYQFRINYAYKGCEIALKYTHNWGFHLEIEKVVHTEEEKAEAEKELIDLAELLGIKIMDDDELKEFTTKIEAGYERGEYTKEQFIAKYGNLYKELG